jgi:hypothetical protein
MFEVCITINTYLINAFGKCGEGKSLPWIWLWHWVQSV